MLNVFMSPAVGVGVVVRQPWLGEGDGMPGNVVGRGVGVVGLCVGVCVADPMAAAAGEGAESTATAAAVSVSVSGTVSLSLITNASLRMPPLEVEVAGLTTFVGVSWACRCSLALSGELVVLLVADKLPFMFIDLWSSTSSL